MTEVGAADAASLSRITTSCGREPAIATSSYLIFPLLLSHLRAKPQIGDEPSSEQLQTHLRRSVAALHHASLWLARVVERMRKFVS